MSELRELSSRSGPDTLVTPLCRAPIDHPSAWKVADFKTPADYTIELSATQLQDIERAMGQMKAAGLGLDDLQREPKIQPYRVADDLIGVAMAGVNRVSRRPHPAPLPDQPGSYQACFRPT